MQLDGTTGNNNSFLNPNQWRIQGRTDRVAFIRFDGDTEKFEATFEITDNQFCSAAGGLCLRLSNLPSPLQNPGFATVLNPMPSAPRTTAHQEKFLTKIPSLKQWTAIYRDIYSHRTSIRT